MPLDCQLPIKELKSAYCDPDDEEFERYVLSLIEEAVEFLRLVDALQHNNLRLIGADFSSYPFKETDDFLMRIVLTELPHADDELEEWCLPFQPYVIEELRELASVFGLESDRPELVVVGALRLNRLFNEFLGELRQLGQQIAIRGNLRDLYKCLTAKPLLYNEKLRRRFPGPIKSFAMKVYDENDRPRIDRGEVCYEDLRIATIADFDDQSSGNEFYWNALVKPHYYQVTGRIFHTQHNDPTLDCRLYSHPLDCDLKVGPPTPEEKQAAAIPMFDSAILFMRKFQQLKKHNLRLVLLNQYRTPHEVYDEDWQENLSRYLDILISFDAYLERYAEKQKTMYGAERVDIESCMDWCNGELKHVECETLQMNMQIPGAIIDEIKSYSQFIPVPSERHDLVVLGFMRLANITRNTLHTQRMDELKGRHPPGYKMAIRGFEEDIKRFEAENGSCLDVFGNVRIIDTAETTGHDRVWPKNAKVRPVPSAVCEELEW